MHLSATLITYNVSTRDTTLGNNQEAAADVGVGRQQHTRQGAEMLTRLRAPLPSELQLENSIGEIRSLLLNTGLTFAGSDSEALHQVSVWLLGRGAKPTEAADFLSSGCDKKSLHRAILLFR